MTLTVSTTEDAQSNDEYHYLLKEGSPGNKIPWRNLDA